MMYKDKPARTSGIDVGNVRLLREIEEISKALYLHNAPSKATVSSTGETRLIEQNSNSVKEDLLQNDKKSSIWNWKPLKALTHIRHHRFNCYFFLHVHSIEGLPLNFNGVSLSVHWKRKDEVLKSRSAVVCEGVAEFEETLMHRCSLYVSKSGPHDDLARYKPKLFLLYASVVGAPGLDIGKHWIDLTRLLPLTLSELEEEKNRNGKWMTSFKLTGKAEGATINVSFGFSLSWVNGMDSSNSLGKIPNILKGNGTSHNGMLRRLGSIPSNPSGRTHIPSPSLDIKAHNESVPYRGSSIALLYELLDEAKSDHSKELNLVSMSRGSCDLKSESSPETGVCKMVYENDDSDFIVIDRGIEISTKDQSKTEEVDVTGFENSAIETIDVAEIFEADVAALDKESDCQVNDEVGGIVKDETVADDISSKENVVCTEEATIEELGAFFHNLSTSESSEFNFSFRRSHLLDREKCMKNTPSFEGDKRVESHGLDDLSDSVVDDFINLLGSDSEPDSPRERLLRQFEKEMLASGDFLFNSNDREEQGDCSNTIDSSFLIQGAVEHDDVVGPPLISRRKAKMLENLETEALMQKWGLNERAFQHSPRTESGAFGSPVYLSPEKLPELPPLGKGLDSFLRTKNGGFLRSMNPSLFKGAKNGERLIMQVSSSVVLPAAMGSNGMDILQIWATVGAEKMLLQATQLMPMEGITGKTLQQVAWEAESEMELLERRHVLLHESVENNFHTRQEGDKEMLTGVCFDIDSEYVPLGSIAPLAVEKIQHLLIEGLRIQSGISNEEPPSRVSLQSIGKNMAPADNKVVTGLSLDNVDELIGMSISVDEWMRLDSGSFDTKGEFSDRISKILAAHCHKMDLTRFNENGELSDETCGCFGNHFTLALQVMLRDPFRDYEPVGISMLALIQVERNYVERVMTVMEKNDTEYDLGSPMFKITEVHVAGFKAEPGKKQQSGSRWLLTSGMAGKMKRHPLSKSNAIVRSSQFIKKAKHEDILWSISSYVNGAVAKWKDLSAQYLHVRNPDIVFK